MFPLSESFLFMGAYAAVFAALCLIFWALLPRAKGAAIWGAIVLTGVLLLAVFASNPFSDATMRFLLGLLALCISPVFALLWAMLVRRFATGARVGALAALVPSVVIAGVSFERQIVPDDLCAQSHVPVRVEDALVHMRPELAAMVWLDGGRKHLAYDRRARNKEDMRKLCDLSAGGTEPVSAQAVLIPFVVRPHSLHEVCMTEAPPAFCEGYREAFLQRLGSLSIKRRDATALRYEMRQRGRADTYFEGDEREGHLCEREEGTHLTRHCRMWRSVGDNALVLLTSQRLREPVEPDELLAQMAAGVAFYLRVLRP